MAFAFARVPSYFTLLGFLLTVSLQAGMGGYQFAQDQVPEDGALPPRLGERIARQVSPQPVAKLDAVQEAAGIQRINFAQALRERMHYDLVDGVVWAMGGDYKISAGPDGFCFMPFLGSDAPKTFKLKLSLRSITLGGEPIVFEEKARVGRTADRITLGRGSVDEIYDCSTQFVEQSFELGLAGVDSELVLDLDVSADGAFEQRADGAFYLGARGGVSYSHAVVIDGEGKRLELEIDAGQDHVRLVVPAEFMRDSVAPVVVDPILRSYAINSASDQNLQAPDVAFDLDSNFYVYVHQSEWSATDSDVWMETYNAFTGQLFYLRAIDITLNDHREPQVAGDNTSDQFLVASRRMTREGRWEIRGRMVHVSTGARGLEFQIAEVSGASGDPVGWDNTQFDVGGKSQGTPGFLVVWVRQFFSGSGRSNIRAALVDPLVPFVMDGIPDVNGPWYMTNMGGQDDTMVHVAKSSGKVDVAEWRSIFVNTERATGQQVIHTFVLADDGTLTLHPSPLLAVDPLYTVSGLDVSEGLASLNAQSQPNPVSMFACQYAGPTGSEIWLYGASVDNSFGGVRLATIQHQDTQLDRSYPSIGTLNSRFALAYVESNAAGSNYACYSTAIDFTHLLEFAVAERKVLLADLGTRAPLDSPAVVTRASGGAYPSLSVAIAVSVHDGSLWTQQAVISVPNQGPSAGRQYCEGFPNSTGGYGFIRLEGYAGTGTSKTLQASGMPLNQFGYFLVGHNAFTAVTPPGSQGRLCVSGGILGRYNRSSEIRFTGTTGGFELPMDPTAIRSNAADVVGLSGQTFNFQAWHRESGGSSNFTNAVSLTLE